MHSKITQNTVHDPAATALPSYGDADYWFALIDEREAAVFLDLTDRTLQTKRQKGGGPIITVSAFSLGLAISVGLVPPDPHPLSPRQATFSR